MYFCQNKLAARIIFFPRRREDTILVATIARAFLPSKVRARDHFVFRKKEIRPVAYTSERRPSQLVFCPLGGNFHGCKGVVSLVCGHLSPIVAAAKPQQKQSSPNCGSRSKSASSIASQAPTSGQKTKQQRGTSAAKQQQQHQRQQSRCICAAAEP